MTAYLRPTRLDDAIEAMAQGKREVIAGGTDYYPARVGRPLNDAVLDITAVDGLRGIKRDGAYWRLGAATTWTDLVEADLPPMFDAYRQAAREVGGLQIQNGATLAGNLCNASPAADGVPPLLILDATVELRSTSGVRELALSEFLLGNRRTARRGDELLTAIRVPHIDAHCASRFLKLGARKYLVISIAMAAGLLIVDEGGNISDARIAVGACSEVAQRLPALESALRGGDVRALDTDAIASVALDGLAPIDDVRATAAYRQDATRVLLRRLVTQLADDVQSGRTA